MGRNPTAYKFDKERQELFEYAQASLRKADECVQKYENLKQRPLEFEKGDMVLLKLTPQIWKKTIGKNQHRGLVPRYDGSFEIKEKVEIVAYILKLLEKPKFHPTFYVSYLKPFHDDQEDLGGVSQRRLRRGCQTLQVGMVCHSLKRKGVPT